MNENGKSKTDSLRIWLIIDTIFSAISILYFSSVVLDFGFGDMAVVAIVVLVIWLFLVGLCAILIYISWGLSKKGKNTKALIWSFVAFVISAICLILGILLKYF